MKRTLHSRIAMLFIVVLAGAYLHFFGMLFLTTSHCAHEASEHAECIATMSGFSVPDAAPVLPQMSVLFFVFSILAAHLISTKKQAQSDTLVLPLVGLFRRGILNPKAP